MIMTIKGRKKIVTAQYRSLSWSAERAQRLQIQCACAVWSYTAVLYYVQVTACAMEDCGADIFRKFQAPFLQHLNLREIVPHLFQAHLVTAEECEQLLNEHYTQDKRIIELTAILSKKGPESVQIFLQCLRQEKTHSGHTDLLSAIISSPELPESVREACLAFGSEGEHHTKEWRTYAGSIRSDLDSVRSDLDGEELEADPCRLQRARGRQGDLIESLPAVPTQWSLDSGCNSGSEEEETASGLGRAGYDCSA